MRVDGSRIRGPAHHQKGGADGLPLSAPKSNWTVKVHIDNKGVIDWLWRGERKCIDPKADADLWIKIWEELQLLVSKEKLVEVEHVKAHRTEGQAGYVAF